MLLDNFPNLMLWFNRIRIRIRERAATSDQRPATSDQRPATSDQRPATRRAYALADAIHGKTDLATDEEARKHLLGQGALKK